MTGPKHLLSIADLKPAEIETILDKGTELKEKLRKGESHELLHGRTLGMIFAKPSTRTRVSFEAGETIADTVRTLSRYVDAIMARLFGHEDIVELARHSSVPVINGLTQLHHPCQTLGDLMTIREEKGKLRGLNWLGSAAETTFATRCCWAARWLG